MAGMVAGMIGVLALQGDFAEHMNILRSLKSPVMQVRTAGDLQKCSGLLIPGGESTSMGILLQKEKLEVPLKKRILEGMPVYATCAGVILLGKNKTGQYSLNVLDATIKRNAYGRQTDSFEGLVEFVDGGMMKGIFIRAPKITRIGKSVEVLATNSGEPVVIRQDNILCSTFHPELGHDKKIHNMFLSMC